MRNASAGVSGTAHLEPAGESATRMRVEAMGGTITGAWVATGRCPETGDEIITVHPPGGTAPVIYAELVESTVDLAVVFLRNGRFVACGNLPLD